MWSKSKMEPKIEPNMDNDLTIAKDRAEPTAKECYWSRRMIIGIWAILSRSEDYDDAGAVLY